jgi:hypothetical protein
MNLVHSSVMQEERERERERERESTRERERERERVHSTSLAKNVELYLISTCCICTKENNSVPKLEFSVIISHFI